MEHLFLATNTHQHFILTVTSDVHKIKLLFPSQLTHWVGTLGHIRAGPHDCTTGKQHKEAFYLCTNLLKIDRLLSFLFLLVFM